MAIKKLNLNRSDIWWFKRDPGTDMFEILKASSNGLQSFPGSTKVYTKREALNICNKHNKLSGFQYDQIILSIGKSMGLTK